MPMAFCREMVLRPSLETIIKKTAKLEFGGFLYDWKESLSPTL